MRDSTEQLITAAVVSVPMLYLAVQVRAHGVADVLRRVWGPRITLEELLVTGLAIFVMAEFTYAC